MGFVARHLTSSAMRSTKIWNRNMLRHQSITTFSHTTETKSYPPDAASHINTSSSQSLLLPSVFTPLDHAFGIVPITTRFRSLSTLVPKPKQNESSLPPFLTHNRVKLKPHVVKKRLSQLKTYIANEKDIRHSPWRLNLVCQFAAGLPVREALVQLQFCQKMMAPLLANVIERTTKSAYHKDMIQMSQLEVAECFATHGTHLKRIKIMGRGRNGIKRRRHSHIRLVLREIDFELKILQAKSLKEKKEWYMKKLEADHEKKIAMKEREELLALEKAAAEKKDREKDKEKN